MSHIAVTVTRPSDRGLGRNRMNELSLQCQGAHPVVRNSPHITAIYDAGIGGIAEYHCICLAARYILQ